MRPRSGGLWWNGKLSPGRKRKLAGAFVFGRPRGRYPNLQSERADGSTGIDWSAAPKTPIIRINLCPRNSRLRAPSDGSGKVVVDYDRISFARHGHTGPRQSKRSSRCHALAWQSYPATLPDRQSVANLRRNYYRICVARHGTMDPLDPNKKFRTGE